MPAMEYLCHIVGIDSNKLSKFENLILEAELFSRIFEEHKKIHHSKHKEFSKIFKNNYEMENTMIDQQLIRSFINDMLQSEAYTIPGIAYYTNTPTDIIQDLMVKNINSPILSLPRKIIELHKSMRPDVYRYILKKSSFDKEDNDN